MHYVPWDIELVKKTTNGSFYDIYLFQKQKLWHKFNDSFVRHKLLAVS